MEASDSMMEVPNGYAKKELLKFRNPEGIAEMIEHCGKQSHIWFWAVDGFARRAKVNGAVRTWKRNPERVEVPLKYGMREYWTFTEVDIKRILIPVE
jgi:hypothetical protein